MRNKQTCTAYAVIIRYLTENNFQPKYSNINDASLLPISLSLIAHFADEIIGWSIVRWMNCWESSHPMSIKCWHNALICHSIVNQFETFNTLLIKTDVSRSEFNFNFFISLHSSQIYTVKKPIHPLNRVALLNKILSQFIVELYLLIKYSKPQIIFIVDICESWTTHMWHRRSSNNNEYKSLKARCD